jgi:hypothetical protein
MLISLIHGIGVSVYFPGPQGYAFLFGSLIKNNSLTLRFSCLQYNGEGRRKGKVFS